MGNLGVGIQPKISFVQFSTMMNWSVRYLIENNFGYNNKYTLFNIGDFLQRNRNTITIEDDTLYSRVTIKLYNKGVHKRDEAYGKEIGTKKQYLIKPEQFILSKIDARNGAFGIVPESLDGAITTADFLSYDIDANKINPYFLKLLTTTKQFLAYCQGASSGTTGRQRINEQSFLNAKIPLPSLEVQNQIAEAYNQKIQLAEKQEQQANQLEQDIENHLFDILGLEKSKPKKKKRVLQFVSFNMLDEWGLNKISDQTEFTSSKFVTTSFSISLLLSQNIYRGKSPIYDFGSTKIILNQKCNRWNEINLKYVKTVSERWFEKIESSFFTKEGDVLINSTGEGTIGRASYIKREFEGLIFDSHLLLIRLNHQKINALYFTYLFNSSYGQKQVEHIKSAQATKQTELGINNLKKIKFPIPHIEIQNDIADSIEKIKSKIRMLEQQAEENRTVAIEAFEKVIFQ